MTPPQARIKVNIDTDRLQEQLRRTAGEVLQMHTPIIRPTIRRERDPSRYEIMAVICFVVAVLTLLCVGAWGPAVVLLIVAASMCWYEPWCRGVPE